MVGWLLAHTRRQKPWDLEHVHAPQQFTPAVTYNVMCSIYDGNAQQSRARTIVVLLTIRIVVLPVRLIVILLLIILFWEVIIILILSSVNVFVDVLHDREAVLN